MKNISSAYVVLSLVAASSINAFQMPNINTNRARTQLTAVKSSPIDEAITIYNSRYASKGEYKPPFFMNWGVPRFDIDGTPTSTSTSTKSNGKRLSDVDDTTTRATFQELSNIYGAEDSLQMVTVMPLILAFDKKNLKPTFAEFGKIFGDQEAKEMIMRNPGLLAMKPEDAAKADDQTMQFSYIIAITRPAGGFLLYGLFGLLMIPVVEGISGIPFRENLLQSIIN